MARWCFRVTSLIYATHLTQIPHHWGICLKFWDIKCYDLSHPIAIMLPEICQWMYRLNSSWEVCVSQRLVSCHAISVRSLCWEHVFVTAYRKFSGRSFESSTWKVGAGGQWLLACWMDATWTNKKQEQKRIAAWEWERRNRTLYICACRNGVHKWMGHQKITCRF